MKNFEQFLLRASEENLREKFLNIFYLSSMIEMRKFLIEGEIREIAGEIDESIGEAENREEEEIWPREEENNEERRNEGENEREKRREEERSTREIIEKNKETMKEMKS